MDHPSHLYTTAGASRLDPLRWAKYFASTKHAGQLYGSGLPYTHHLASVEAVLRRFGAGDDPSGDFEHCSVGECLDFLTAA